MSNLEKFNKAFISVFNINEERLNSDFSVDTVVTWDSISQLSLVTEIEDQYEIMLDTEDILNFKSYTKGKEILTKYGIVF